MTESKSKPDDPLPSLPEMLNMTPEQRAKHELRVLQGLMAQAVAKGKYSEALKIFESAQTMMNRRWRRA